MDHSSKKSRKYNHTLYDNVVKYNENVCGTFVNVNLLKDGLPHTVDIDLIIPFDDICALQAFSFYPNSVIGDLELQFYVGREGLIYTPIETPAICYVKTYLQGDSIHPITSNTPDQMQPVANSFFRMANISYASMT
jgi:hypothetical protein